MKSFLKITTIAITITSVSILSGCSSISTVIEKRDLTVETKMSDTIFLEPVSSKEKRVFIQLRNTTDKNIDARALSKKLKNILTAKGYSVTQNMDNAVFVIQQNLLSVSKTDKRNAYGPMQAGFGGALVGGTIGGITGSSGSYGQSMAIGSLIGAGIGLATNALVKDVYYNMVTDLQIRQRVKGNKVNYTKTASAKSGSSAGMTQTISGQSEWLTYRTRIVSVANKVNLEFVEAQSQLENKMMRSVSGIF